MAGGIFDSIIKKIIPGKYEISKDDPNWIDYRRAGQLFGNSSVKRTTPEGSNKLEKMWNEDNPGKVNPYVRSSTSPTLLPSVAKKIPTAQPTISTVTPTIAPSPTLEKKQVKVGSALYDAASKFGEAYGIPKENFIANSNWEHRNVPSWSNDEYAANIWGDEKRGEESYGPYQINMNVFGPAAVKKGFIAPDHPLYITPEDAKDPWKATEWMAKKWKMEMDKQIKKNGSVDWNTLFQQHNPLEKDRGKNVQDYINTINYIKALDG